MASLETQEATMDSESDCEEALPGLLEEASRSMAGMETQPITQATSMDSESDAEEGIPDLLEEASRSGGEQTLMPIDREDLPGRPVCAVPVVSVEGLALGDHVLLETAQEPYRPWYQSGLVVETDVQRGRMQLVRYKKEGVSKEWVPFETFHQVYLIPYTHCRYSQEEAIERAEHRVRWEESLHHPLFNNSHHLVTWAKTGRENPLTNILKDLEYQGDADCLEPALTKAQVSKLEELKPGDHIMISSEHWLVKHVNLEHSTYTAITWSRGRVSLKEKKWEGSGQMHRFDYDSRTNVFPAEKVIRDAESDLEATFSSSDEFVSAMKTGNRFSLNDSCLFSTDNGPVSYTPVTADTAIDEGDHLVIKDSEDKLHSILLYKYIGEGIIVGMPDVKTTAIYGSLDLTTCKEVHRINYRESLPIPAVLRRACSRTGEEFLRSCGSDESDKFISWAKAGRVSSADITKLQVESTPQVAQLRPWERERVTSIDEIQVGDHLIQPFRGRWFHFMVTECRSDPSNSSRTKAIYCFRGVIGEKVVHIDPRNDEIHRICYPESLPAHIAIQRARSKLGIRKLSPLARMWFVRWAKTGSDEGIEVNFLANNAVPGTKSRIVSFAQLNPGDYLVGKKQKLSRWRHYLVVEILSPTHCVAIGSWGKPSPDKITEGEVSLETDSTYYRLNYNDNACISPDHAISTARQMIGKSAPPLSKYTRQRFVNFVKTLDASVISVDEIPDDRLFLPRERIESLADVKPGDHLECSDKTTGKLTFDHTLVTGAVDKDQCKVLVYREVSSKGVLQEMETNLLKVRAVVFRINYPERIPPQESVQLIRKSIDESFTSPTLPGSGEACVVAAVIGEPTTIRVDDKLHNVLQYRRRDILKPITVALGVSAAKSSSARLLTLSKITAKETAKETAIKLATRIGLRLVFRLGLRAALSSTAMGVFGGSGLGIFLLVEGPLLARGIYKLHRKKKFEKISETEFTRGVIQETVKTTNLVIGAVGGAIVGQILIPVPGVGAGIGVAVGTVAGSIAGTLEGHALSKLVREKRSVTLPVVVTCSFTDKAP